MRTRDQKLLELSEGAIDLPAGERRADLVADRPPGGDEGGGHSQDTTLIGPFHLQASEAAVEGRRRDKTLETGDRGLQGGALANLLQEIRSACRRPRARNAGAQNLAESNLISLLLKTPFPPRVLIDWMAQAKLYVAVKNDLEPLRRLGVRTAFDLRRAWRDGNSARRQLSRRDRSGG